MDSVLCSIVEIKSDGNTAFLRAARSGNLDKVLEFINANVDINTSNSNGLNALHLASKDGHTEVVAELLKRGANVDAATKKGNTALHIASLAGQEEVVKLLIEHGASVNVQSQSGFTPLYMAAQENHEKVVRYLLNHGANQSLATEDGFTPLAVAMQQGHDKVVTELLENDTRGKIRLPALHIAAKKDDCKAAALLLQSEHNPDITSKSGFTPLHIASHYGNDAIASLLLAKGADVNYAAKHNITPLHVAAKWGRNNMVVLLLDKGASIMAKTRDGLTPLHCAARSGHEQVVDTLLVKHAPITAKTKNGLAPLHMASQGDHVEAARVLLSHRAPVDDVTVDYLTALHVASHCGHVSVAKLLLDRKADPNARALNGFTPLHIACKKNRVKIVELLLKHLASIEATTESGLSPLHVASFMGCMNIVIFLLQCEANPDVSTIRGETPLHLASRANQTDIIRILLRNGAQVDAKAREQQTPLHIAARLGNTDIVMLLLQHGANVDSVTKDLYTSLHIAAKEDQEDVAQILIENGASLTAATKKGFTPLHLAAKYGRTKIATLLLQRGAPVDAQGKNGVTPLHVASHYDHQGIALLLLDRGASPHATAKNGHTPLHIAAKKNQMDIAAMLLEYGARADVESKAGFTPLHLAAQEGHVDMTNLLLEHKSDANQSSKNGLTPLHLCAQEDCVDVAKILVKNKADPNAVTKAGYTPLHIASHFGQLNMVRFLLSQKVKIDTATSTGYTPLHQAAQQGNSAIVAVLLDNGASPNSKNNQGLTALYIAQKLGYISVVEVLKNVTKADKGKHATNEDKYKVVAPETMQENFMSDSEDEGGDDATNEQSYRYLTIDEMKSLGDDSMPLDVIKEDRYDTTAGVEETITPQHSYNQLSATTVPDNVDVTRTPVVQTGFLVSFLVDAKGGAMRGCRHSGVRVIVPPQCVTMPTRVTCRYVRRDKPSHPPPPPLMEGEALASRILELGPTGVKFLGPVVIEVPNFAALRGNEREIVILRSDNGETWREHTMDSSAEAVRDILSRSFDRDGNQVQTDEPNRITSIVTTDFPHYFAVVSRIRQEVHAIGPEGGMVSSSVVPQVQAVFPQGALTKKIKVGLQAQAIPSELTAAVLGNCVAVSPIVTIEPRRRKFHKPIILTLPVPQAANKGMINQYSGDAPTLRLLCSITGGTSKAQWEDVTGSTPLTFVKECVSFTTTVSARFWLMDIREIAMATKKATELYREAILTPFMVKFVVFAKKIDSNEARLRVFCMTDDKEDKTLECQEHFTEVAKSRDVEVLEGKKQLIELSGNLISVTKSGDQLRLGFSPFHENRLPFTVRIKDSLADPIGRMLFFKEQKPVKTSTPHPPICVLNIVLPDGIVPDHEYLDSPMRNYSFLNDTRYHKSELPLTEVSKMIDEDWVLLADKLGINSMDANAIKFEYPDAVSTQAFTMLQLWNRQAGNKNSLNILENALISIGRQDIVQECILNWNESNSKKQNGTGPYPNEMISDVIENYHIDKKYNASTDDDERKYTGEEKAIDEPETKKSVSERKMEIEERLKSEKTHRSSIERSESEENRRLPLRCDLEQPVVFRRQNSQQRDIPDGNNSVEPTSLTFEQKRLSFERGISLDNKVVPQTDPDETKQEEKFKIESKVDVEEKVNKDEKSLTFAEKRLSFEQAAVPAEKKEVSIQQRSVEDKRRDSELLEGVSVGLGKLEAERSAIDQCFLSPKPGSTPPPSPAEFKKQDSEESDKSSKRVSANDSTASSEASSKPDEQESGHVQQHSHTDSITTLNCTRVTETQISKQDSTDYTSKKKFWQSFESSSTSESKPAPVPKPRASICTTSVREAKPPLISKRSAENIVPSAVATNANKDKVHKSESEDNVVFATSTAVDRSAMKRMHSVTTAGSTDSEAEYIAACGIEKLAYENVAFSEEDEDRSLGTPQSEAGGVKAKKMFFESMQKENSSSQEDPASSPSSKTAKSPFTTSKIEEHIDKSEVESTEKSKTSHSEDVDESLGTATSAANSSNGCNTGERADSSEEDDVYDMPNYGKGFNTWGPGGWPPADHTYRHDRLKRSSVGQLGVDVEAPKCTKSDVEKIRISEEGARNECEDRVVSEVVILEKSGTSSIDEQDAMKKITEVSQKLREDEILKPEVLEKVSVDYSVKQTATSNVSTIETRSSELPTNKSEEFELSSSTQKITPDIISENKSSQSKVSEPSMSKSALSDVKTSTPDQDEECVLTSSTTHRIISPDTVSVSKSDELPSQSTPPDAADRLTPKETAECKSNLESKIPLLKRTPTNENLKSDSKPTKADTGTESRIPIRHPSISDKSVGEHSESDDSSCSDYKSTPTRIPIAKSPLAMSESSEGTSKKSEEKKDPKGTPSKIPIVKSQLTTSQSEIVLHKGASDVARAALVDAKSASLESKALPLEKSCAFGDLHIERKFDSESSFDSNQTTSSEVSMNSVSQSSVLSDVLMLSDSNDDEGDEKIHTKSGSPKVSFNETRLREELERMSHSETTVLDTEGSERRVSITEDEAKVVAESLITEIETELNKRPDIVENLLLMRNADYIRSMSVDPVDDLSNDITDEDLRSTGTDADIFEGQDFYDKDDALTEGVMRISEASPTEYRINYEQAEEFNVLESVDFEEQLIAETACTIEPENRTSKSSSSVAPPPPPIIPEVRHATDESTQPKQTSEESSPRNDLMSPESVSSSNTPSGTSGSRSRKSGDADLFSTCSSSDSHYQSLTLDNRLPHSSRPCSSDVEILLSCAAGSSDYETAVSHDTTSYHSHDFHTAVSSASIHESLHSIDSESSGHLGSAEVSSEMSETLVPSSCELEHDIDMAASGHSFDDKGRGLYRRSPLEPYDQDIPVNVIRNAVGSVDKLPSKAAVCTIVDDRLMSSCEDSSSVSTEGANLPTAFEIASNESDRMDNSLTSEQSLTMSAISNQLSTSSSDFRDEVENDRKMTDSSTSIGALQTPPTSVTLFSSTNEDQERQNVCTQVISVTEEKRKRSTSDADGSPSSPIGGESFEIIEKPNLLDDFVVIADVAKEIKEDVPPKTTTTLTQVKYYSSATTPEDGSGTFERVTFEQGKPAPPVPDEELYEHEVEEGKKWIEMQFQTDSEAATAYEYAYERAPLEDIKEEDTDDMQSSKIGSVGSQISQSIPSVGSAGSMKQSLSSTPDYDVMVSKRGAGGKPAEPDTVSQASLQEFERLEQMMTLESMKGRLSGSQDSVASSGGSSGGKKRSSDNVSVTSLKEFEGLEHAILEAEKIEERAKVEERSLSQIEEGHESQASESESCETLEKSAYDSDDSNYDQKMFEIDEIIRQAQTNVEQFVDVDQIEKSESLGRGDSFEETSRIPDLELDQPLTDATHSSSEVYSGKKYIENVDASHSLTVSTDSLELKNPRAAQQEDALLISTDSLEGGATATKAKQHGDTASDSLEDECRGGANTISDRSCVSEERGSDILHDEFADSHQRSGLSPTMIGSPDSVDATSSTATHATYQNEGGDSIMSSSFTSGGSNTMISSAENFENVVSNYANWLDEGGHHRYVSETVETVVTEDCSSYSSVHQCTKEGVDGVKVVYRGPEAKAMMERDIESFGPGEFYSETRETGADGKVRVERVVESRSVVSSEHQQVESTRTVTLENRATSGDFSDELLTQLRQQRLGKADKDEQHQTSVEPEDENTKEQNKDQRH